MTRYQIVHKTRYEYARPVSSSYQHLHLTPRSFAKQNVISSDLLIEPAPTSNQTRQDYFGNPVPVSPPCIGAHQTAIHRRVVNDEDGRHLPSPARPGTGAPAAEARQPGGGGRC